MGNFKLRKGTGNTDSYHPFQKKGLINPIQTGDKTAKQLKKEKEQAKKAAELTYTTRYHEWLKENPKGTKKQYNNTKEGKELAMDVSARESETQNY